MRITKTIILSFLLILAGCDQTNDYQDANEQTELVFDQIIQESIDRYEIVKNEGNAMDTCLQAGVVKSAMLASKNEVGFKKWKSIEKVDCYKAGMHRF